MYKHLPDLYSKGQLEEKSNIALCVIIGNAKDDRTIATSVTKKIQLTGLIRMCGQILKTRPREN